MIENIVTQGVTVDLQPPAVLQLELAVVGQLLHVLSTVRLILEIKLDHGPACLRVVLCRVVSGVETVLIGRHILKTLGLDPLTLLESRRAAEK